MSKCGIIYHQCCVRLQVFFLLESIYTAMDTLAKKRKVFKVETVGDSYVAVAGCPVARKDHASVMVRFAVSVLWPSAPSS